jgi:hypothetical protein
LQKPQGNTGNGEKRLDHELDRRASTVSKTVGALTGFGFESPVIRQKWAMNQSSGWPRLENEWGAEKRLRGGIVVARQNG